MDVSKLSGENESVDNLEPEENVMVPTIENKKSEENENLSQFSEKKFYEELQQINSTIVENKGTLKDLIFFKYDLVHNELERFFTEIVELKQKVFALTIKLSDAEKALGHRINILDKKVNNKIEKVSSSIQQLVNEKSSVDV